LIASNASRNRRVEPVVITGMGLLASVGLDRESVWQAVRSGQSGVRRLSGLPCIPDGLLIGAPVPLDADQPREHRVTTMCRRATAEALADAEIDWDAIDRHRFGCAISGHMGDTGFVDDLFGRYDATEPGARHWWEQWLPNTACSRIASENGLLGPRICHSTACASGLIDILAAVRSIQDGQCDIALAGSGESIHPLFAAGFHRMRVLADDDQPQRACRPFDLNRKGFVMGEGAGMFVLESLSHALGRGAEIYAEVASSAMAAEAHHVTGLDADGEALSYVIRRVLKAGDILPREIDYINAHGTGTQQNDVSEIRGIRHALGRAAEQTCVSSTKSMLGHLVNAAGSVELGITALALRDGFVPPTINLTKPDPGCDMDCLPQVGRRGQFEMALKLSVAFGGHLVGVALRRWKDAKSHLQFQTKPLSAA